MSVIAVYNMKGGVGKTTAAVNLSYLPAAAGQRVLLWDLDPQAASSFAFRVRPRVEGFSKKWIRSGQELAAGIRETDYAHLDLLPADFTHRKLERLLGRFSKPTRVVADLIETVRRDYDLVILDCPAGFSLVTEGVFAASDLIVVPTIPTVLSLRMVTTLTEWAVRAGSPTELAPFLSMVDRRKSLHRQICEWTAGQSGTFMMGQIPYASIVEQMTIRRAPLATFAPRDLAAAAFAGLWKEIEVRLQTPSIAGREAHNRRRLIRALESLIVRLESQEADGSATQPAIVDDHDRRLTPRHQQTRVSDVAFTHRFDTEREDVQWCGCALELRECAGSFLLVAAASSARSGNVTPQAEAQIDASWATNILAGAMSPLDALERRLGLGSSPILHEIRAATHGRTLRRVQSRLADGSLPDDTRDHSDALTAVPILRTHPSSAAGDPLL